MDGSHILCDIKRKICEIDLNSVPSCLCHGDGVKWPLITWDNITASSIYCLHCNIFVNNAMRALCLHS